jgi:hypothetical protein
MNRSCRQGQWLRHRIRLTTPGRPPKFRCGISCEEHSANKHHELQRLACQFRSPLQRGAPLPNSPGHRQCRRSRCNTPCDLQAGCASFQKSVGITDGPLNRRRRRSVAVACYTANRGRPKVRRDCAARRRGFGFHLCRTRPARKRPRTVPAMCLARENHRRRKVRITDRGLSRRRRRPAPIRSYAVPAAASHDLHPGKGDGECRDRSSNLR